MAADNFASNFKDMSGEAAVSKMESASFMEDAGSFGAGDFGVEGELTGAPGPLDNINPLSDMMTTFHENMRSMFSSAPAQGQNGLAQTIQQNAGFNVAAAAAQIHQTMNAAPLAKVDQTQILHEGKAQLQGATAARQDAETGLKNIAQIEKLTQGQQNLGAQNGAANNAGGNAALSQNSGGGILSNIASEMFSPKSIVTGAVMAAALPTGVAGIAGAAMAAWTLAQATFSDKAGTLGSEFSKSSSRKDAAPVTSQVSYEAPAPTMAALPQGLDDGRNPLSMNKVENVGLSLNDGDFKIGTRTLAACKQELLQIHDHASDVESAILRMSEKGLAVNGENALDAIHSGQQDLDRISQTGFDRFRIEATPGLS